MELSRSRASAVVVFGVLGCEGNLDPNLTGKLCSIARECLPGYVCSPRGVCEPNTGAAAGGTRAAPASEAGPSGAATSRSSPPRIAGGAPGTSQSSGGAVPSSGGAPQSTGGALQASGGAPQASDGAQSPSGAPGAPQQPGTGGSAEKPQCAAGTKLCDGQCAAIQSDVLNCGDCRRVCDAPEGGSVACVKGHCTLTCGDGLSLCDRQCVDTTSDPNHCGKCDVHCNKDQNATCVAGVCESD